LDAESIGDLRKMLIGVGYSVRAVEEILKWYMPDNSD